MAHYDDFQNITKMMNIIFQKQNENVFYLYCKNINSNMQSVLNKLSILFFLILTHNAFSQREPLAIIVNSTLQENWSDEIKSLTTNIFLENGFSIVERKHLDKLFSEYEDQKREDYFDGETIKIKIEGAKYYCFLDAFQTNQEIKVFLFFVDIFQEKIMFSKALNFDKNIKIVNQFENYKYDIIASINKNIPINLHYFSRIENGNLKLLVEKSNLQIGSKIYGFIENEKICEFEIVNNLTSNMIECSLINFNKKLYGKSKDYDFSNLDFTTQLLPEVHSNKRIQLINTCLDTMAHFELVVSLNSNLIVEDNIHRKQLQFEQKLQSNELFMNGKSYFDLKQGVDNSYIININSIENYCNYIIKQNNVILSKGKYTSAISLINEISSF